MIEISRRDRVLLLSLPGAAVIRRLAGQASEGILVGIGNEAEVREMRPAVVDLVNVMLVPAPAEEIPWQERFFSVIVDWIADWNEPDRVAREIARVLSPGGSACVAPEAAPLLAGTGLEEREPLGGLAIFYKPVTSPR